MLEKIWRSEHALYWDKLKGTLVLWCELFECNTFFVSTKCLLQKHRSMGLFSYLQMCYSLHLLKLKTCLAELKKAPLYVVYEKIFSFVLTKTLCTVQYCSVSHSRIWKYLFFYFFFKKKLYTGVFENIVRINVVLWMSR